MNGSALMNVKELAFYLNVHNTTIYRMLKAKRLPAFKIGADWRFDKSKIDAWIKEQHHG